MIQIAIVEDNLAEAQLLERALRESGIPMAATIMRDGEEAIRKISNSPNEWDLVLLDLNLPKLNGCEVLDLLRAREEFKDLPIVVLSGSADPADIHRCYRAGANSYVCKSIHLREIFEMADRLLNYWVKCAKVPARSAALVANQYNVAC